MTSDGVALVKMALVQKLRRQECILTSKYFFFLIISFLPLNVLDISTISLIPENPQIFKYTVIKNALNFKAFLFLIIGIIFYTKAIRRQFVCTVFVQRKILPHQHDRLTFCSMDTG